MFNDTHSLVISKCQQAGNKYPIVRKSYKYQTLCPRDTSCASEHLIQDILPTKYLSLFTPNYYQVTYTYTGPQRSLQNCVFSTACQCDSISFLFLFFIFTSAAIADNFVFSSSLHGAVWLFSQLPLEASLLSSCSEAAFISVTLVLFTTSCSFILIILIIKVFI